MKPLHAVLACLLLATSARAVVITSNLTLPTDGIEAMNSKRWLASQFSTDGNSYLINAISLKLQQTVKGAVQVSLYSDSGGRPGEMMMTLTQNGAIGGSAALVTFRGGTDTRSFSRSYSSREIGRAFGLRVDATRLFGRQTRISVSGDQPSGLGLDADSKYWVVTRALSGSFASAYTDQETGEGIGYSSTWAASENAGATWTMKTKSPLFLEVLADPADLIVTDNEAIASAIFSGLPMAMAQREAVFAMVRTVTRDVNERLFRLRSDDGIESRGGGPLKEEPTGREPRWEIFATAGYGGGDVDTMGRAAGFQTDTWAETVGDEFRVSGHFTIGAAFTYVQSNNSVASSVGDVDIEGESLAAYASYHSGGFYADALYGFSTFEHDIQRDTLFGNTASAEPNSRTHALQLNLGYNMPVAGFVTGPYASIDWMIGQLEDYQEANGATTLGSAALRVPGQNFDSLISRIGWQISRTFALNSVRLTPQLRADWAHEFRDDSEAVDVRLATSPYSMRSGTDILYLGSFRTSATTQAPGSDSFEVGFALGIEWGDRFTLIVDYGAQLLQDDAFAQSVSLTGSFRF